MSTIYMFHFLIPVYIANLAHVTLFSLAMMENANLGGAQLDAFLANLACPKSVVHIAAAAVNRDKNTIEARKLIATKWTLPTGSVFLRGPAERAAGNNNLRTRSLQQHVGLPTKGLLGFYTDIKALVMHYNRSTQHNTSL
ncbi:hypothetical protein ACJX0J_025925 [Zea mays]